MGKRIYQKYFTIFVTRIRGICGYQNFRKILYISMNQFFGIKCKLFSRRMGQRVQALFDIIFLKTIEGLFFNKI